VGHSTTLAPGRAESGVCRQLEPPGSPVPFPTRAQLMSIALTSVVASN